MCLWRANYLWQWQEGFCNTQLHYKDSGKVLEVLSDNSHTVGATASIYCHLTVTNAHRQGQKIMAMDGDCHRDHSKLMLIADRGKASHSRKFYEQLGLRWRDVIRFLWEITSFAILLMRRKCFLGCSSGICECVHPSRALCEQRHHCPVLSGQTRLTRRWLQ